MPLKSWIIATRPGDDVGLVVDVGRVGRQRRQAEHRAEAGGEDEQPDQRPDERREEAAALVQKAQRLAPDDAAGADQPAAHCAAPPVRRQEGVRESSGAGDPGGGAGGEDFAAVQDVDGVVGQDLLDQVGGPEDAHAFLGGERVQVGDDVAARGDVEADGRLVAEQQPGRVQQRRGDLDAPRLAAGEGADALAHAVGQPHAAKQHGRAVERRAGGGGRAARSGRRGSARRSGWHRAARLWKTTPRRASAARGSDRTSWPQTSIMPDCREKRPVTRLNSVVLPAPLTPISAVKLPCATASEMSSSASRRP